MSSTYSPDLRIELIGTGDQAGVWGATTNNNLAYVIEQAVAGYISVSVVSANQALTYINGGSSTAADNQAVHASLALTTSTGANFAVYAPPASKQYTIYNASSYVATVYNSTVIGNTTAAGTGVAIPAGKTMTVWSDGTNFAQQNTHLTSPTITSPTLATPTITGVSVAPTASFGTSTTQLATTAFVQAALQALHPVGSIYTSTVSTNPGTAFGFGTWVAYGAGRVLIGDGGGYSAGATGGSADAITVAHTHTASSSFSGSAGTTGTMSANATHSHTYSYASPIGATPVGGGNNLTTPSTQTTSTADVNHTHSFTPAGSVSTTVDSTGSSGTNANLQPYVVVYIWNRTA